MQFFKLAGFHHSATGDSTGKENGNPPNVKIRRTLQRSPAVENMVFNNRRKPLVSDQRFLTTKESGVEFADNILKAKGVSSVLFVYGNEKVQRKIILEKGASLKLFAVYLKNAEVKNSFVVGENSKLEICDIFFGNVEIKNEIQIEKANCILNLAAKGTIRKNETANYSALASIGKNAVNANVNVEEHAYLLEKGAKANLIPGLEISNNEVNARHASTLSQLDEEQIFYLMSRGFSEESAKKEIVSGFLSHDLKEISQLFGYDVRL